MVEPAPDFTEFLIASSRGEAAAADRLMPLVYRELRGLAGKLIADEPPGHTLQPTALVHEAYLRLIDQTRASWNDEAHFAAMAATMMRRILIDHARGRRAAKRGGGRSRQALSRAEAREATVRDFVDLDEALDRLAESEPRAARVVELRFFGGLDIEQTASVLGVGTATIERDWRFARAWLYDALDGTETPA